MKKIVIIILLKLFYISNAYGLIEVDITRGNLDPLPIAVSPLHVDVKSENYKDIKVKELGANISKIIERNFIFNFFAISLPPVVFPEALLPSAAILNSIFLLIFINLFLLLNLLKF